MSLVIGQMAYNFDVWVDVAESIGHHVNLCAPFCRDKGRQLPAKKQHVSSKVFAIDEMTTVSRALRSWVQYVAHRLRFVGSTTSSSMILRWPIPARTRNSAHQLPTCAKDFSGLHEEMNGKDIRIRRDIPRPHQPLARAPQRDQRAQNRRPAAMCAVATPALRGRAERLLRQPAGGLWLA